jgi:hypothetical protein
MQLLRHNNGQSRGAESSEMARTEVCDVQNGVSRYEHGERNKHCVRCEGIGRWRTHCTGSWMWRFGKTRTSHTPENLATLRHIDVNLLEQERSCKLGVRSKRLKAGRDEGYRLKARNL